MRSIQVQPCSRGANINRLNPSQIMFVEHLLANESFDPRGAAERAGYKNPKASAQSLLNNKIVAAAVGKAIYERQHRIQLTADDVLNHLQTALFLDPAVVFQKSGNGYLIKDLDSIPEPIRRCITKLKSRTKRGRDGSEYTTIEVEFMSKDAMLPLVMKHLGMLDTKGNPTNFSLNVNGNVNILNELLKQVEDNNNVVDAVPKLESK